MSRQSLNPKASANVTCTVALQVPARDRSLRPLRPKGSKARPIYIRGRRRIATLVDIEAAHHAFQSSYVAAPDFWFGFVDGRPTQTITLRSETCLNMQPTCKRRDPSRSSGWHKRTSLTCSLCRNASSKRPTKVSL